MPDPLFTARDETERLLRQTEGVLKKTTTLLQSATDRLTAARTEPPRIAALRNELQVLRTTVYLLEQAILRGKAHASLAAHLLKVAG